MGTIIGITDGNRKAVSVELSKLLADEFILYTKTRNAHWNVEGPDFHSMHLFFATLKSFLELTHLTEKTGDKNDSVAFIKEVDDELNRH